MACSVPLLTVPEVAARLRVSPRTIRRRIEAGELPAVHLGGPGFPLRLDPLELERWLKAQTHEATEAA